MKPADLMNQDLSTQPLQEENRPKLGKVKDPLFEPPSAPEFYEIIRKIKENQMTSCADLSKYLFENPINTSTANGYGVLQILCQALIQNTSLSTVIFSIHILNVDGAKLLVELLKNNKSLEELNLAMIVYTDDEAFATVLNGIKENTTLRYLNVCYSGLGKKAAIAVQEALKQNNTLKDLCIYNNPLGDEGIECIAEGLKTNKSLRHLDIRDVGMGEKGANAIANALKINQSLRTLDISGNSIGAAGSTFATVLHENYSMQHISFGYQDKWTPDTKDAIEKALGFCFMRNMTNRQNPKMKTQETETPVLSKDEGKADLAKTQIEADQSVTVLPQFQKQKSDDKATSAKEKEALEAAKALIKGKVQFGFEFEEGDAAKGPTRI